MPTSTLPPRKPLAGPLPAMESGEPHSIRFTPSQWQTFVEAARWRGIEVTRYIRECAITGHGFIAAQEAMQSSRRTTA